ncbi:hypothetical protein Tco_0820022 [Tanacetum coccineum]|uniref:Uncharacterized protein n=1 Tax=Tanacetum coccineum TaxID=301880 RepID=A0ABQ5A990_9ASTR
MAGSGTLLSPKQHCSLPIEFWDVMRNVIAREVLEYAAIAFYLAVMILRLCSVVADGGRMAGYEKRCRWKLRLLKSKTLASKAMFNVLNRSSPIPETLSSEGNVFLKRCLQKNTLNMADHSSAVEYPNTHIQRLKRAIHHHPHAILLCLRLKFFQVYVIPRFSYLRKEEKIFMAKDAFEENSKEPACGNASKW